MAHVAKFQRCAMGHMCAHYNRTAGNIGNDKVIHELSGFNYNLASKHDVSQVDFINQRCLEVQCLNRKDVNVMCSWVITLPQGFNREYVPEDEVDPKREFFEVAYRFLSERYGEKNVVSAYVHMDETTPHMHFAFVPVVMDKKRGVEKVSAKELLSRRELQRFHSDLDAYMEGAFGYDVGVMNEATKDGNKSVEELKRGSAREKLAELEKQIEVLGERRADMVLKLQNTHDILTKENEAYKSIKKSLDVVEGKINALESEFSFKSLLADEIRAIKPVDGMLNTVKGVKTAQIEELKSTCFRIRSENVRLESENDRLKVENARLGRLVPSAMERMKHGEDERKARAFDTLPQEVREQVMPSKSRTSSPKRGYER